MTHETQENFQEPQSIKKPDEDFDDDVRAARERSLSMMRLNEVAAKVARMEKSRKPDFRPAA